MAEKILYHLATEIRQIDLRGFKPGAVVQRDAVDPLHGEDMMAGAIPVHRRYAEIGIVFCVLRHLGKRGRFEPQIHFHRDGARECVDDLDRAQPAGFGGNSFHLARGEHEVAEVAPKPTIDIGPQHLDGNGLAGAVLLNLGAMHLRDGRCCNRFAEADKHLRYRLSKSIRDHGFRLCLRKCGQAILQVFEVACHRDANHIGTRGKKLPELDVSRTKPRQCARQPPA